MPYKYYDTKCPLENQLVGLGFKDKRSLSSGYSSGGMLVWHLKVSEFYPPTINQSINNKERERNIGERKWNQNYKAIVR